MMTTGFVSCSSSSERFVYTLDYSCERALSIWKAPSADLSLPATTVVEPAGATPHLDKVRKSSLAPPGLGRKSNRRPYADHFRPENYFRMEKIFCNYNKYDMGIEYTFLLLIKWIDYIGASAATAQCHSLCWRVRFRILRTSAVAVDDNPFWCRNEEALKKMNT